MVYNSFHCMLGLMERRWKVTLGLLPFLPPTPTPPLFLVTVFHVNTKGNKEAIKMSCLFQHMTPAHLLSCAKGLDIFLLLKQKKGRVLGKRPEYYPSLKQAVNMLGLVSSMCSVMLPGINIWFYSLRWVSKIYSPSVNPISLKSFFKKINNK